MAKNMRFQCINRPDKKEKADNEEETKKRPAAKKDAPNKNNGNGEEIDERISNYEVPES